MQLIKLSMAFAILLLALNSKAQTKTWVYDSANNSGSSIKITEGEYGVSDVFLSLRENSKWNKTKILSIDTSQEYIKVKSDESGASYQLYIDWNNDKLTMVETGNTETIFWLRK